MADRRGRRGKQPNTGTIVGSGRRVRLDQSAAAIRRALGNRETWQEELWAYYDSTPEAKHAVLYTGGAMSKIRLFPAAWPEGMEEEGDPIPVTADEAGIDATLAEAAVDELRRLRSEIGGQSEILRLLNMNLEVAGEAFLVYRGPRDAQVDPNNPNRMVREASDESWNVYSTSEIQVTQGGRVNIRVDGGGRGIPLEPDMGDQLLRIWIRHPRWSNRADSAMYGVLMELRILQSLSNEVLAISQSGMHRGVFKVPNGLVLAKSPVAAPDTDPEEDPLLSRLADSFAGAAADPDSPYTVEPTFVRGEREDLSADVFGFADIFRQRDAELREEISAHARRFARGINLPVEVVEGHMATTFSNAEQIDQDTFDDYHEPRVRTIVDALTVALLRPNLLAREDLSDAAKAQVPRIVTWYDPGDLVRQPDTEGAADKGAELGFIGGAAWRRVKGYTDDDAPDALELIINTGLRRGTLSPELTRAMIQRLADEAGIEIPEDVAPEEATEAEANVMAAAWLHRQLAARRNGHGSAFEVREVEAAGAIVAAASRQRDDLGFRLQQIDARLLDRVLVASSSAMDRAIERAGNWIRSHVSAANRSLVASAPAREVAARLGPAIVGDAIGDGEDDDVFAGAWATLGVTYMTWVEQAQAEALAVTGRAVVVDEAAIVAAQRAEAAVSWEWMRGELRTTALARLFDPDPAIPLGESDPTLRVPVGLVRQALARAGGSAGLEAAGADAGYVTTTAGQVPAGGVATGEIIMGALRDAGATVGQFTWVYGASRPNGFEPHEDLDGLVFDSYDDPQLANNEGWPPFPFYFPFDHQGCQCWVAPSVEVPAMATPQV